VQEALTNVRKHAAADAKAEVTIEYVPAALHLAIRNNGSAPDAGESPDGSGSGIAGMRARVESLGGTLQASPLPDGGFHVCATLPAPAEETA
jgi:signal transduction histidine kinase